MKKVGKGWEKQWKMRLEKYLKIRPWNELFGFHAAIYEISDDESLNDFNWKNTIIIFYL